VKRFDKLVVLDLDETLIYSTEAPLERPADFRAGKFHVYCRPGLSGFLTRCLDWFWVGVWTSSSSGYAETVVNQIFPKPSELDFVWARDRCVRRFSAERQHYFWIKDLAKLKKHHPLEKILIVDDTSTKLMRNYGNHILIRQWIGDLADRELAAILEYLEELGPMSNVRTLEKRGWWYRKAPGDETALK
jgi:RNA polymerase II subunit A small phosphatase-like protein